MPKPPVTVSCSLPKGLLELYGVNSKSLQRRTDVITLIGISGSLRRGSFNSSVLRAAASLMPAESELHIASIADIPLYNADAESTSGIPEPVARLKDAIAGADGLLLVSPEYNNSVPGVTKNAIDWLSRPSADIPRVFG